MEYFVSLINATTIACEKFITVTFHNSAVNNIVFEIFLLQLLFVFICICVCEGEGVLCSCNL